MQQLTLVDFRKSPSKAVRRNKLATVTVHGEAEFVVMDAGFFAKLQEQLSKKGLNFEELARTA